MSIEAISWVLNRAPIPAGRRDASSLAMVLIGLANHADPEGCNAFPSVGTLVRYTRLSERSVQNALRALEELGLITPSDPQIVAAYVKRADRRPNGWDLVVHSSVHNRAGGVQTLHPVGSNGVQILRNGVQTTTSRGAESAPEPSLNHPGNRPARKRASTHPAAAGSDGSWLPVCGQCDGRPTDPITARVVWLDTARKNSVPCPRCHPVVALAGGGGR
jgi:hypothetical protein